MPETVQHTDPNPFAPDPKAPRSPTVEESQAAQVKREQHDREQLIRQRGGAPLPNP